MSNIFAELQQMSSTDNSVLESREILTELTNFMRNQEWQEEQIGYFAEMRQLKPSTLIEAGGFMVPDNLPVIAIPEEFRHDSLGFVEGHRLVYSGRFVYPVYDVKGYVAGFVGYDKFEEPKYLDSKNYGYKSKQGLLFGMEKMREFYEEGYVFVTEGPACKLWFSEHGFNSLSSLGSYLSPYAVEILRRFGNRCFVFPDSDETGLKFKKQIRKQLPQAQIRQCLLAKDVDDSTKDPETGLRVPELVEEFVRDLHRLKRDPFFISKMFAA